jgi:hypothetical protein
VKLDPINWKMATHPMNWVVVVLMLVIAGAIGHMILSLAGFEPATSGKSSYGNIPVGQVPAGDAIDAINPASAGYSS